MYSAVVAFTYTDEMHFINSIDSLIELIEKNSKDEEFKKNWDKFDPYKKLKYILFSSINSSNLFRKNETSKLFKIETTYIDLTSLIKIANYLGIDEKGEYTCIDATVVPTLNVLGTILNRWYMWDNIVKKYNKTKENMEDYVNGNYPYMDEMDYDPFI